MVADERLQFLILVGLSLGVVALTATAYLSDRHLFQKYLGRINPILASVVIVFLGGALLLILLSQGWLTIYQAENPNRFLLLSALAGLMAVVMILIDLKIIFPEDLNIPFPQSLLFYPAIGYSAEVLFHILPLTITLILLTSLLRSISFEVIIWSCIFIISLAEPIFQTKPMAGKYPFWATAYVGLHVLVINVIQLVLFFHFDFITMYSFRLAYYLFWHIAWGYLRIGVLF